MVDPKLLYLETYSHRTSRSPISKSGNIFLLQYILEKKFTDKFQILEIGCNDTYLLENMSKVSKYRAGIDPIFDVKTKTLDSGIRVKGGFAENIEYEDLIENPIDLIISAHTFEHIMDPISSLNNIKDFLAEKIDFIIEVPSSLRMIEQLRLDQVFSQHINYYSPKSLQTLMGNLGLHLVDMTYNYSYWGGTQILHFSNHDQRSYDFIDELELSKLREAIRLFENDLKNVKFKMRNAPGKIFAFGAAQMLPIIQYHLGTDFNLISEIFDDNIDRVGKFFPLLDIKIKSIENLNLNSTDTFIITALDSSKPIIKRLLQLSANLIIVPVGNI
jgi:hypothetical protein